MANLLDLLSMNEKNRALETAGFRGGNAADMNRALFQAVDKCHKKVKHKMLLIIQKKII